jgi:hypothetical protein
VEWYYAVGKDALGHFIQSGSALKQSELDSLAQSSSGNVFSEATQHRHELEQESREGEILSGR